MLLDEFDYDLPEDLIAVRPPERRDAARMLVVSRTDGTIAHANFVDVVNLLGKDDLCVLNDTRVVRSRFFSDDGRVEIVRTSIITPTRWTAMVRPGKRMKRGRHVVIGGVRGAVHDILENGDRVIDFESEPPESSGALALPHYLDRDPEPADEERYQTVFADRDGAIAAPTAGLHFTPEILARLRHAFVTLHVGVGTFRPVRAEQIEDHVMHREAYNIPSAAAEAIASTRARGGRIVAVGTTVARTLEHAVRSGPISAGSGSTDLFIYPGFQFRAVDALLTNFHLPKSTLFMLVCAFAGRDLMMQAYAEAVHTRCRFFSYGDCMLIL